MFCNFFYVCVKQVTTSIDGDRPLVLWLWPVGWSWSEVALCKQVLRQIIFTLIPSSLSTPHPTPSHSIQVNRAEYLVTGDRNVVTRQWFASAAKLELAEKHSSPVSALLVFCHSPLSCFVFCHSPLSAQFVFCVFSLACSRCSFARNLIPVLLGPL